MGRYNSHKPQQLGNVLQSVIDRLGLQEKLDETNVIEAWAEIAGPQINAVTESAWLKKGQLYVKITSATWRHELHLSRRSWCERLNKRLGKSVVDEILFR